MAIPNVVGATDLVSGIPGEIAFDGPQRAIAALINSADPDNNVFGHAFTYADEGGFDAETVQAGGTGFFAGIMIVPKAYALDGELAANGSQGEFLCEGEVYVALDEESDDFTIGAPVWFNTTTGSVGCGTVPAADATQIFGAYVSRHNASPVADGTPRLAVIYLPGLANLTAPAAG